MKRGFSGVLPPKASDKFPEIDMGDGLPLPLHTAKKYLEAYTDGSCKSPGDAGGWAFYALTPPSNYSEKGGSLSTTNNEMELTAILKLIEWYTKFWFSKSHELKPLMIYSDSQYCIKSITIWSKKWRKNGFKTENGEPVKNAELIINILNAMRACKHQPAFKWVKGHSNIPGNELCDKMATSMAHFFKYEL